MRFASSYIAKLRQENDDLQAGVRALDSVWTKDSFGRFVPWLHRQLALGRSAQNKETL
jgi:hypothetical protein